jgi:hypothetical protein
MMKTLCATTVWLLGCLWFAGAVFPAAAANPRGQLQDIAVHVQGDKRHNNNGEPLLANSRVRLKLLVGNKQEWEGRTDAKGRCVFPQKPRGPYLITAEYHGVSGSQTTNPAVSNVYFKLPVAK